MHGARHAGPLPSATPLRRNLRRTFFAFCTALVIGTLPAAVSAQGADVDEMPLDEAFEPGFQVLSARGRAFLEGLAGVVIRRPFYRRRVRIYCGSALLREALVELVEAHLAALGVADIEVEARGWSNAGPGSIRAPRLALGFAR